MLEKSKHENGSVTIEATISLSAFMFAIVTILTIVNICIVQARISYAINATAKEISQYSYLYSLTGLPDSQYKVSKAGKNNTQEVSDILSNINSVYNEIENLGNTGKKSIDDIDDITSAWNEITGSVDNIKSAGSSIENSISKIAENPKQLMFGIAQMAASETFNLAMSRAVAAPLSKVMCKKHLVNSKDGDVDSYLKYLGVVPSASGSYIDGLDFSKSSIFPNGINEIKVNVSYDVKIIPLLPIDFSFHFNQTAITNGWLKGEESVNKNRYKENSTLWTEATITERSNYIRHMAIEDMKKEGYKKTAGLTDVQLYNEEENEFVMIASMNPLYSAEGEPTKTLDDLSDEAMREAIERLCGKMKSTTDGLSSVTIKDEANGIVKKETKDCEGAGNKIVLVIPQDEGLKERVESVIETAKKNGVVIEVVTSYGNGASKTKEESGKGEESE